MKAISLWQPWAALVALGLKKIETRGRATSYRGPLVIHAAKRWNMTLRREAESFVELADATVGMDIAEIRNPARGAFVALVQLVDVIEMTEEWLEGQRLVAEHCPDVEFELAAGDYKPGRFAWILEDTRRVEPAFTATGRQWLWAIDELAEDIERRSYAVT